MIATTAPEKLYTVEEYLAFEKKAQSKYEYHNGKIVPMPGGTVTHNQIASRLITALTNAIDAIKKEFIVYNSDMKIQIPAYNHFVYLDAVVVCEQLAFYEGRKDIITNPILVAEVLSPSTEEYDQHMKFDKYRKIPSFREYLLVRQDGPFVSTYFREEENLWRTTDVQNLEASIALKSIECALPLSKIYKGVTFETPSSPTERKPT